MPRPLARPGHTAGRPVRARDRKPRSRGGEHHRRCGLGKASTPSVEPVAPGARWDLPGRAPNRDFSFPATFCPRDPRARPCTSSGTSRSLARYAPVSAEALIHYQAKHDPARDGSRRLWGQSVSRNVISTPPTAAFSAHSGGDLPLAQRRAEEALQHPAVGDPVSLGLLRMVLSLICTWNNHGNGGYTARFAAACQNRRI